jgi:hypothetical protein
VGAVPAALPETQMSALLAHRIFITKDSGQILGSAVICEFSIIFIQEFSKTPEQPAEIISRNGWPARRRRPFLARTHSDYSVDVNAIEE